MLYKFLLDGGPYVFPVLAASVIALALILERAWFFASLALSRDGRLRKRMLAGEPPPPSGAPVTDPVARVLAEALRNPDDLTLSWVRGQEALREARANLFLLELTAAGAAVIGVLGTALASRDVFRATADAAKLGAGLSLALHPLIAGLVVFLVAIAAVIVFRLCVSSLEARVEEAIEVSRKVRTQAAKHAEISARLQAASAAHAEKTA